MKFAKLTALLLYAAILVTSIACATAAKKAPVIVAQASIGLTRSIDAISQAGAELQKQNLLPTALALKLQTDLKKVNDELKPLPDYLVAVDNAQKAGAAAPQNAVDQSIAILMSVGSDLTTVLAGVPVSQTTTALINLVKAAQATIQTVLVNVARFKTTPAPLPVSEMRLHGPQISFAS